MLHNASPRRLLSVRILLWSRERCTSGGNSVYNTFNIKTNDIVKLLGNLTDWLLYVKDFCICYCLKSMWTIEHGLQQNLNKIENWATCNGLLKFSFSKTQWEHFCQLREQHKDLFFTYIHSLQKETQTFKWTFWGVKIIDFQNDSLSVDLSFNKDLYNRVSSKIWLWVPFWIWKSKIMTFTPKFPKKYLFCKFPFWTWFSWPSK